MSAPVRYFTGVDLGQSQDFTAIAVLERAELTGGWDPVAYAWQKTAALRLRYLERVALGTPYPDIVTRVRQVVRAPDLLGKCHLAVDATGVGRPVVDLLRRAGLGCNLLPAVITSGEREAEAEGYYRVPKRDLIVGLQVLLQTGVLQIAAGLEHGATLAREMAEMRVKVTDAGREQYGVWREGHHDDMVLAVALACWGARKVYPNPLVGKAGRWRE
jgi:hypothetical protein